MVSLYFEVYDTVRDWIWEANLEKAIAYCENLLQGLPNTPFHCVVGRTWLEHRDEALRWLVSLRESAEKEIRVRGLLCELSPFVDGDWTVEGFGYSEMGDFETFCFTDVQFSLGQERLASFELPGMDDVKEAFRREFEEGYEEDVSDACDIAIFLVILRVQELFRAATLHARETGGLPKDVPIVIACNDWDPVCIIRGAETDRGNGP